MTVFKAMLGALNLSYAEASEVFGPKVSAITDMARGKLRVPAGMSAELNAMFERVEAAADEILADQAESAGDDGTRQLIVDIRNIDLPHPALQEAAAARALLVVGPRLLVFEETGTARVQSRG